MDFQEFSQQFDRSPSLKLLRSDNAALALFLFYSQFKKTGKVSQSAAALTLSLGGLLEDLAREEPTRYPRQASQYLDYWTDQGFLRQTFADGSDERIFQLMPGTEKALGWLEDLKAGEFVGTESRLKRILASLRELVENTTRDPKVRLKSLELQKAEVETEMERIKASGRVETFSETQAKERFQELLTESRRLLSDFKQVEDNFRDICRQLQATRLKEGFNKGKAVQKVLDADEELKRSDQGKSFDAFWKFLRSPSMQKEFKDLVDAIYGLPELQSLPQKDPFLKRIKGYLMDAADEVLKTNHRLAEQLKRMLVEKEIQETQRVSELIGEIRSLALGFEGGQAPSEFFMLEENAEMDWAMARPIWRPPQALDFSESRPLSGLQPNQADLQALFNLFHIDFRLLRERIDLCLETRNRVTLEEIISLHPLEKGLAELVAYVHLAAQYPGAIFDPGEAWTVALSSVRKSESGPHPRWQVPGITFLRPFHD